MIKNISDAYRQEGGKTTHDDDVLQKKRASLHDSTDGELTDE